MSTPEYRSKRDCLLPINAKRHFRTPLKPPMCRDCRFAVMQALSAPTVGQALPWREQPPAQANRQFKPIHFWSSVMSQDIPSPVRPAQNQNCIRLVVSEVESWNEARLYNRIDMLSALAKKICNAPWKFSKRPGPFLRRCSFSAFEAFDHPK